MQPTRTGRLTMIRDIRSNTCAIGHICKLEKNATPSFLSVTVSQCHSAELATLRLSGSHKLLPNVGSSERLQLADAAITSRTHLAPGLGAKVNPGTRNC